MRHARLAALALGLSCTTVQARDARPAAATAVMAAWQRHVQHSPAVTSPATAQHLCDRMDELTARTRQDLAAEGRE